MFSIGDKVECFCQTLGPEVLTTYPKVAAWRSRDRPGVIACPYGNDLYLVRHSFDVDRIAIYHEDELRLSRDALIEKFKYGTQPITDDDLRRLLDFYGKLVPLLADMGTMYALAHRDAASDHQRLLTWQTERKRA